MFADAVPNAPSSSSAVAMLPLRHIVRQRPSKVNRSASVTTTVSSNVATTTAPVTATVPPLGPPPATRLGIKQRVRSTRVIPLNADAAHFRINVSTFIYFGLSRFLKFMADLINKRVFRTGQFFRGGYFVLFLVLIY